MKKYPLLLGPLSALLLVSCAAKSPTPADTAAPTPPPLGGDRDEHGCIGSAGYSWCEPKKKCLRPWEEDCFSSAKEAIVAAFATKYKKPASAITVTILEETETHAAGSVSFAPGGAGERGIFLAALMNGQWAIAFDGNGAVDCKAMREQFAFPESMLKKSFCD